MAYPCLRARPLRLVRLARYGHLDRWIGTADLKAAPERFMGSPLPDDLAMCELYISVIKVDFFPFVLENFLNGLRAAAALHIDFLLQRTTIFSAQPSIYISRVS